VVLVAEQVTTLAMLTTHIRVMKFADMFVGGRGVVDSTLASGSIGHGFQSEHRLFSHHGASAFSKLRSLAKFSLDDSVRRLL